MINRATDKPLKNIETVVWYVNPNIDFSNQKDFLIALSNLFDRRVYESNGLTPPEACRPILCSDALVPNQTNFILENFSPELVDQMKEFKEKFPQTQYVVVLTEFLGRSGFGYKAFNCFDTRTFLWAFLTRIALKETQHFGCPEEFDRRFSPPNQLRPVGRIVQLVMRKLGAKHLLSTLTKRALNHSRVRSAIAKMLKVEATVKTRGEFEIRLDSLFKVQGIVSLWVTILSCQGYEYRQAGFQHLMPLPLLFDNRIVDQLKKRKKGIFCSKNMTDYRRKVLTQIQAHLDQDTLPDICEIENAYQSDSTIAALPQIELYIPKSKNWPYSSPMRTFKTLINGCQPMSFGCFEDHELMSLSQKIDPDSIDQGMILMNDSSSYLRRCHVREYHRSIYPRALKLNAEIAGLAAKKFK